MKTLLTILVTLIAAGGAAAVVVHSGGLLNFAGDEPHPSVVEGFIEVARERFIAQRSAELEVPDLSDPKLVEHGAAHYVPMCAGCHLGPGTEDTEIRRGLYPQPPNLAQPEQHAGHDHGDMEATARRQFWIIKHGIKMTAMPAWGATHDDNEIWGLVAFLQKLPEMPPEEYAALQAGAKSGHEGAHEHGEAEGQGHGVHQGGKEAPAGHVDAPGTPPHSHGDNTKAPAPKEEKHEHSH